MTLKLPPQILREKIGSIAVNIQDPTGQNNQRSIDASITVTNSNGVNAAYWDGDLLPHIPAAHLANLVSFLDWLRAEAEVQFVG